MKRKQEQLNKEFCKKHLTADWDGCAANDYFISKCQADVAQKYAGKPKLDFFNGLLLIEMAENAVYTSITHLAFTKSKLVSYLSGLTAETVQAPENIEDKSKYLAAFLSTAKAVLDKIKNEEYDFQKPNHNLV